MNPEEIKDEVVVDAPATEEVDHEVTQADLDANPAPAKPVPAAAPAVGGQPSIGQVEDAPVQEEAKVDASTTEAVVPQKFYRGSLIVSEEPRTVGAQTFQHVKTVEGHDFDLTEDEYKADVTVK